MAQDSVGRPMEKKVKVTRRKSGKTIKLFVDYTNFSTNTRVQLAGKKVKVIFDCYVKGAVKYFVFKYRKQEFTVPAKFCEVI